MIRMSGAEVVTSSVVQVFRPARRAFFVYYVALALCFFGPAINPEVGVPVWLGICIGLVVAAAVGYMWSQEYQITDRGVAKTWRWTKGRQEIPWENLGEVQVLRGLVQSLLRVGNLRIKARTGDEEMFWFGLANPKEVEALIEQRRI
jgi:uncharacterized membrane protein YdbT with pleckstrin-like domain